MGPPPSDSGPDLPPDAIRTFDLDAWANEREVTANVDALHCAPANIAGAPPSIWCFRMEAQPAGRALYLQSLLVVERRKLVKVFEIPYAAGIDALDSDQKPMLAVKLVTSYADKNVLLADDERYSCDKALEENGDADDSDVYGGRVFRSLIDKVCASRGTYRWQNRTLRRANR
jgi:hypothetical protein